MFVSLQTISLVSYCTKFKLSKEDSFLFHPRLHLHLHLHLHSPYFTLCKYKEGAVGCTFTFLVAQGFQPTTRFGQEPTTIGP